MGPFWMRAVRGASSLAGLGVLLISSCADREIHDITMSIDSNGNRPRQIFYTDTTNIYCVYHFATTRTDVTIDIVFRQIKDEGGNNIGDPNSGGIIWAIQEMAPGINTGIASATFPRPVPPLASMGSASGALPFPVGALFRCEIYVDGLTPASEANNKAKNAMNAPPQQTAEFKIVFPDCPVSYPEQDIICIVDGDAEHPNGYPYYRAGNRCRGADVHTTCQCNHWPTLANGENGKPGSWNCCPGGVGCP